MAHGDGSLSRFSLWVVLPLLTTGILFWWFFYASSSSGWAKSRPITLLAFGDSLTEGYGVLPPEAYPSQLEEKLKALGYSARVINAGISGDTTRGGRKRLTELLTESPDLVLLGLGSNDALQRIPSEETEENLRAMITELRNHKIPFILLGAKSPLNGGLGYVQKFNAIFPRLAEEYAAPLIPFILEDVALRPQLNIEDGIHPNGKGYTVMVEKHILPAVHIFLRSSSQNLKE